MLQALERDDGALGEITGLIHDAETARAQPALEDEPLGSGEPRVWNDSKPGMRHGARIRRCFPQRSLVGPENAIGATILQIVRGVVDERAASRSLIEHNQPPVGA